MPQRWDSAAGRARRHRTGCKLCPARSLSRSGSTDEGQPCRHRSTTIRLERGSVLGKPSTAIANTLGQASLPAECTAEELLTKVGAGSIPRAKAGKLTVYVCMSVINFILFRTLTQLGSDLLRARRSTEGFPQALVWQKNLQKVSRLRLPSRDLSAEDFRLLAQQPCDDT